MPLMLRIRDFKATAALDRERHPDIKMAVPLTFRTATPIAGVLRRPGLCLQVKHTNVRWSISLEILPIELDPN